MINNFNINFFKIALKNEFKWFSKARRSQFFVLLGACIPLILYFAEPGYKTAINDKNSFGYILFYLSLAAIVGQYFLDSIYKDLQNKVNIFYSNLNIPKYYSFVAKFIMCIPFCLILFCINMFFKMNITILFVLILILFSLNVALITYIISTYFFSQKSVFLSLYLPLILTFALSFLSAKIGIIFLNFLLQLSIVLIMVFIIKILFKSKKITCKLL